MLLSLSGEDLTWHRCPKAVSLQAHMCLVLARCPLIMGWAMSTSKLGRCSPLKRESACEWSTSKLAARCPWAGPRHRSPAVVGFKGAQNDRPCVTDCGDTRASGGGKLAEMRPRVGHAWLCSWERGWPRFASSKTDCFVRGQRSLRSLHLSLWPHACSSSCHHLHAAQAHASFTPRATCCVHPGRTHTPL